MWLLDPGQDLEQNGHSGLLECEVIHQERGAKIVLLQ